MEIQVLSKKTKNYQNWVVDEYNILAPIKLLSFTSFVGIDPGSCNLGLAFLYSDDEGEDKAKLWQIKIERDANPIQRMMDAKTIIQFVIVPISSHMYGRKLVVIENAAYAQGFRQVELAEQRAVMAMWLVENFYEVTMIAPMTIRKKVFGSGKIKAHEAWQLAGIPKNKQPTDALAALSCAYYGMMS